ncbi:hypothetical protein RFI_15045 [Reticulomyxa filosa]|uniref:Uncharacterized protein n=1 Tax=Reticulomyxa filosa TaxID=46433 RepID=X6N7W7_RETFI|nr:hypothetical protein RFI_15045 [Reticulomyxa filosa]|eukprot:ETO22156.1 hypothetical protein RFI_15045 [Reticulomyxa filosa]
MSAQDRWPPRVAHTSCVSLPFNSWKNVMTPSSFMASQSTGNINTNKKAVPNSTSHIALQQFHSVNNKTSVVAINSNSSVLPPNGHTQSSRVNSTAGNENKIATTDKNSTTIPNINFYCSFMENGGFPGMCNRHLSHQNLQQPHESTCTTFGMVSNGLHNNNNGNGNNSNVEHSTVAPNNTSINNNNNNNSVSTATLSPSQEFIGALLAKYRALEADRNRHKKKLDECMQEKHRACLEVEHWKHECKVNNEKFKQFVTHLETQKKQLEMANASLKRHVEELEHKCSQLQLQQLMDHQLHSHRMQMKEENHELLAIGTCVGNNQVSDDHNSHNASNLSAANNTNDSNNHGTNHYSPASTPDQQVSPEFSVGAEHLYATIPSIVSSNSNPNQKSGILNTEGSLSQMNVAIGMDMSTTLLRPASNMSDLQMDGSSALNTITNSLNIEDHATKPTRAIRDIIGRKRKGEEIGITFQPHIPTKR